ncbi:MAG: hypothetical protein KUL75_02405, partial [Sterolibacterium sp.]|nr:hypothetical protein [Sterolibacterium sp.]
MGSEERPAPHWHALSCAEVAGQLQADLHGLSAAEAQRRIDQYGRNQLAPPPRRGPLLRFILQFHDVLLYVVLAASVITAL